LREYLNFNYKYIGSSSIQTLLNIAKVIGSYKFLKIEFDLKQLYFGKNLYYSVDFVNILTNYFLNEVLTDTETIKLKTTDGGGTEKTSKLDTTVFKLITKKKCVKNINI
jgi:hypothetical protein